MSSYFDEKAFLVANNFSLIIQVESQVIKDVSLVTGDREFPEDLRMKIQAAIAVWRYKFPVEGVPETQGKQYSDISKRSYLIDEIHEYFHELAIRRIKTRFGYLRDNPVSILSRREEYLKEAEND